MPGILSSNALLQLSIFIHNPDKPEELNNHQRVKEKMVKRDSAASSLFKWMTPVPKGLVIKKETYPTCRHNHKPQG